MKIFFGILIALLATEVRIIAAEAGMPQLDPEFWASQAFWLILIFASLYLIMSKIFIPKIKDTLDNRDNKIKDDLDDAKNLNILATKKQKEYELTIENAKKEVQKIIFENKNKLQLDIQAKKNNFDKEIESELNNVQKEILDLKKNSIDDISKIAQEIASQIIENISGDKLNESSIKAAISETSKKKIGKYLWQ
jgi:F-type H+-transporting ATPase subunit b